MNNQLHELERIVLTSLKNKEEQTIKELSNNTGLTESSIYRALLWLGSKKLINLKEEVVEEVQLDVNGKNYQVNGLPEKRFAKLIQKGIRKLSEIKNLLSNEEFNISIGLLKNQKYISIHKDEASLTWSGKRWLKNKTIEEKLIELLNNKPQLIKNLNKDYKKLINLLIKRKQLIKINIKTIRTAKLLNEGKRLSKHFSKDGLINKLTTEIIKSDAWKLQSFKKYDLNKQAEPINYGKKTKLTYLKEKIRNSFLQVGFKEKNEEIIVPLLWNKLFSSNEELIIKEKEPLKKSIKHLLKLIKFNDELDLLKPSLSNNFIMQLLNEKEILKNKEKSIRLFTINENKINAILINKELTIKNLIWVINQVINRIWNKKIKLTPTSTNYTKLTFKIELENNDEWLIIGSAGLLKKELTKTITGLNTRVMIIELTLTSEVISIDYQY